MFHILFESRLISISKSQADILGCVCVCVCKRMMHALEVSDGHLFFLQQNKKKNKLRDGLYFILAVSSPVSEKRVWEALTGTTGNRSELRGPSPVGAASVMFGIISLCGALTFCCLCADAWQLTPDQTPAAAGQKENLQVGEINIWILCSTLLFCVPPPQHVKEMEPRVEMASLAPRRVSLRTYLQSCVKV